ncbi:hypothetical protein [Synechococcus sp. CCY 9618]|uniref:hypothetical protein n=1 Tax=Synechococcus sp. CCY 9618 TaxID=2815602 RepID=UPI001C22CEC1|nr:hypothetical protein [Synechococcus sp. CCY 9618]
MTRATKTPLLLMLGSSIGFLIGMAWGIFFGFPSPDAGQKESLQLQFHANLSGSIMALTFLVFGASGIYLLQQRLLPRRRDRS